MTNLDFLKSLSVDELAEIALSPKQNSYLRNIFDTEELYTEAVWKYCDGCEHCIDEDDLCEETYCMMGTCFLDKDDVCPRGVNRETMVKDLFKEILNNEVDKKIASMREAGYSITEILNRKEKD